MTRSTRLLSAMCVAALAPACAGQKPAPNAPKAACVEVPGSAALFDAPRVVLVGEMHGTREFPELIGQLACSAHAQREVVLLLEIPRSVQPALDAYLADPSAVAEARLFSGEFWTRDYQDGRTSEAMAQLIVDAKRLGAHGQPLRVIAIDDPAEPTRRDHAMAERIAEVHAQHPNATLLGLVGNVHNRITAGVPWDAAYRPMGLELVERGLPVLSLQGTYAQGTSWYCETEKVDSCGVKPLDAPAGESNLSSVHVGGADTPDFVNGTIHIGVPHASQPAVRMKR